LRGAHADRAACVIGEGSPARAVRRLQHCEAGARIPMRARTRRDGRHRSKRTPDLVLCRRASI
jgi:hypothetical protein